MMLLDEEQMIVFSFILSLAETVSLSFEPVGLPSLKQILQINFAHNRRLLNDGP